MPRAIPPALPHCLPAGMLPAYAVGELVDPLGRVVERDALGLDVQGRPIALVLVHVERVDLVTVDHQTALGRARLVVGVPGVGSPVGQARGAANEVVSVPRLVVE